MADEDLQRQIRSAESLGWLSQSSLPPKRQRLIEGVQGGSLVGLKAEVYKAQEEAKLLKAGQLDAEARNRRKAGVDVADIYSKRNAGVGARDEKDQAELKSGSDRLADCYAALERKAKLYEQLAAGRADDDEELYNVDFLSKGTLEDERELVAAQSSSQHWCGDTAPDSVADALGSSAGMMSRDMDRERERRDWEADADRLAQEERAQAERRRQQRQVIDELAEQTKAGREKAAMSKQKQEGQAEKKREQLKLAFLRKQLEAVKAAKSKTKHKVPASG